MGGQAVRYYTDTATREPVVSRFTTAPTLHVIGPAGAPEHAIVRDAVDAINEALPPGLRIRIGAPKPETRLWQMSRGQYTLLGIDRVPESTIYVEYVSCAQHHSCGLTRGDPRVEVIGSALHFMAKGYVQLRNDWKGYGSNHETRNSMAHEIVHALGLSGHVAMSTPSVTNERAQDTPTLLTPIDREGLRVVYGALAPGDRVSTDSYGPWSSESLHLTGETAHAYFGVAHRNGYAEPWAEGVRPATTLSGNRALSGAATWSGTLVGLTPTAAAVTGDARLSVTLATLRGEATFSALEQWAPRAAPGAAGTGTLWGDGTLTYQVRVEGNGFRRTGGDAGTLRGLFTGPAHEGAAGTLERTDLTAAFGVTRQ